MPGCVVQAQETDRNHSGTRKGEHRRGKEMSNQVDGLG